MIFNITASGQVERLQFKVGDLYKPVQSFVPTSTPTLLASLADLYFTCGCRCYLRKVATYDDAYSALVESFENTPMYQNTWNL